MNRITFYVAVIVALCCIDFVYAQAKEPTNARELSKLLYDKYRIGCPVDRNGNIWAASFSADEVEDASKAIDRIVNIPTIQTVEMHGYHLNKEMLTKLHKLPNLSVLKLGGCRFEDDDLEPLKDLRLTQLDLANTPLTDAGLVHLKPLKQLGRLRLSRTKVTGSGFKHLESLPIHDLSLTATPITDESLKSIGKILSLKVLDLSQTSITDDGLLHLSGLYLLRSLNVDEAQTTHAGRDWFREDYAKSRTDAEQRGLVPKTHPELIIIEN